jgi:hypothetical protein
MSEASPKLVAIDEEAKHQIVHRCRFGKAYSAMDSSLNPSPQIDVFALNFLRMLFADFVLLGVDMTLIGARMVKKLMQLRARRISGVPRVVHDTEANLHALGPG